MEPIDDLWANMSRVLSDGEELAAEVAAELGEPLDEVRPSVVIGSLARPTVPATVAQLEAAIETERHRVRAARGPLPPASQLPAMTMEELVGEVRRLEAAGSLDLDAVVSIQRAAGALAARADQRLVLVLHRYAVTRRLAWERVVAETSAGRLDPTVLGETGRVILLWNELTSLAVTDGYRTAERDIVARNAEARRGALQEILGVVAEDPVTAARLRRVAARYGLNPARAYRLVAVAPHPDADPIPERPGIGREELDELAGRIGHLLGSAAPGAEGVGAGIRLPTVLPLRGRIAIFARAEWPGFARVPRVLDTVLGPLAAATAGRRAGSSTPPADPRSGPSATAPAASPWVAVGSHVIDGIAALAPAFAELVDATRTAQLIGLHGWIPDPGSLAVERLLLASRSLGDAALEWELGPLLADQRLGEELVETLQVYFDAGENMRETARRLHLASRTVAYRLEKIEALLGPLDDERRRRVSVALLVHRLRSTA